MAATALLPRAKLYSEMQLAEVQSASPLPAAKHRNVRVTQLQVIETALRDQAPKSSSCTTTCFQRTLG